MTSLWQRWFGPKAKSPAAPAAKAKPVDRGQVIAQALSIHKTKRAEIRELLNRSLLELRGRPPSAMDPHRLVELMALYRAHMDLKTVLTHDLKRYLVLAGLRGLLGEATAPATPAGHQPGVKVRRIVARH